MGSIHHLLNPLTYTPPQCYVLPGKPAVVEDENEPEDVVTLDAEAKCYTPSEMRAPSDDSPKRDDSGNEEAQIARGVPLKTEESGETRIQQSLASMSQAVAAMGGSGLYTSRAYGEDAGSRRTSSSSLADILNPVEEESKPQQTVPESLLTVTDSALDHTSTTKSPVVEPPQLEPLIEHDAHTSGSPNEPRETEEEIMVDVVGLTPKDHQVDDMPITTNGSAPVLPSEEMYRSISTDSGRTITDIVEDSPAPNPPTPPTPSKKRKFTPESSPDEPLSIDIPNPPTETIPQESETSVEKPQAPSRASKKPKKVPIRRPQPSKKKALNGQMKPTKPKSKELSMTMGLDDVGFQ